MLVDRGYFVEVSKWSQKGLKMEDRRFPRPRGSLSVSQAWSLSMLSQEAFGESLRAYFASGRLAKRSDRPGESC